MKIVRRYLSRVIKGLCCLMFVAAISGCSSQPATPPQTVIKSFIQKHISMIDLSVADFYVNEEQAGIRALVNKTIQQKKSEGTLALLKMAKYNFGNLNLDTIAEKEDYVNDETVDLVEIKASGFYTVSIDGKEETVVEDEVFVLESVGNEWKVTEKIRPWK